MKSSGLLASIALAIQELTDGLDLYEVRVQAGARALVQWRGGLPRRDRMVLGCQPPFSTRQATNACGRTGGILLCGPCCFAPVLISVTCSGQRDMVACAADHECDML